MGVGWLACCLLVSCSYATVDLTDRETQDLQNSDLLDGWAIKHESLEPFIHPAYWKDSKFVHLQGVLRVGHAARIFVLPEGFRPKHKASFLCVSAPDDQSNETAIVTALPGGTVLLSSSTGPMLSLSLRGYFPVNGPPFRQMSQFLTTNATFSYDAPPTFLRDPTTAQVFLHGRCQPRPSCTTSSCRIFRGLHRILPHLRERVLFPHLPDSAGRARVLEVTPLGDLFIHGTGPQTDEVVLDGVNIVQYLDELDRNEVLIESLELAIEWTGPLTKSLTTASGSVFLTGIAEPTTNTASLVARFRGASLGLSSRHPVACLVGSVLEICSIRMSANEIFLLSSTPLEVGDFTSLAGLEFGGHLYRAFVTLGGQAAIDLTQTAHIFVGP